MRLEGGCGGGEKEKILLCGLYTNVIRQESCGAEEDIDNNVVAIIIDLKSNDQLFLESCTKIPSV